MMEMVGGIMRDLEKEQADYAQRWSEIAKAAKNIRPTLIARCCARHELESDEMMTAEEKALFYYPYECKP
jgi:hypothetical protein